MSMNLLGVCQISQIRLPSQCHFEWVSFFLGVWIKSLFYFLSSKISSTMGKQPRNLESILIQWWETSLIELLTLEPPRIASRGICRKRDRTKVPLRGCQGQTAWNPGSCPTNSGTLSSMTLQKHLESIGLSSWALTRTSWSWQGVKSSSPMALLKCPSSIK